MENIFVIGTQVTGKSFIGRDKYLKDFRKAYFRKKGKTTRAIVGLARIGKTSFIHNAFKKIPNEIIYIYEDVGLWNDYYQLWKSICRKIYDYLKANNLITDILEKNLTFIRYTNIEWEDFVNAIKVIFQSLCELKLKTIIVLEEFDYAMNIFTEIKHWQLFRTIFADLKYNVSAITISKRSLKTIEGDIPDNFTFHGIFDTCYFKGFDDDDMKEYYKVFEKMKIKLDDKKREEIEYYCGRLPLLLSIMGYYIVESFENKEDIDITNIFLNKCMSINDYYKTCIKYLKIENDLQRLIPFIFGPNIGATKSDKDELTNLGYLREENEDFVALSKYFGNFLSINELNLDIWNNIISLEKKIKNLIFTKLDVIIELLKISGDNLNEIQKKILEKTDGITSGEISKYENFMNSNLRDFNRNSSFFDVMSLADSFKIMKQFWQVFSEIFNNDRYDKWENKFDKCANARNPVAHGHEEYLSEADCKEIDIYCEQIFDILKKVNISGLTEKEIFNAANKFKVGDRTASSNGSPIPEKLSTPNYRLLNLEFPLEVREVGRKGNFSGIITQECDDGETYKYLGKVQRNTLKNIENFDDFIGKIIKVRVERIENNHCICEYLGLY